MMDEAEALRFLEGQRISLGSRTMDPKAQIVGEFVKSIRVPGYFPPLAELRQQLRTMVTLMDEPAPPLPRIEDITIPARRERSCPRLRSRARRAPPCPPWPISTAAAGCRAISNPITVSARASPFMRACSWLPSTTASLRAQVPRRGGGQPRRLSLPALSRPRDRGRSGSYRRGRRFRRRKLSAVVSQLAARSELPVPTCQVLIYPAVDFFFETASHRDLEHGHVIPARSHPVVRRAVPAGTADRPIRARRRCAPRTSRDSRLPS
jgi:hypothetical protein